MSFFKAIQYIDSEKLAENFLKDLLTPTELKSIKERFEIAQIIYKENLSYRQIQKKTGASLTTIGRVSRFLKDENNQGYIKLFEKMGLNNV